MSPPGGLPGVCHRYLHDLDDGHQIRQGDLLAHDEGFVPQEITLQQAERLLQILLRLLHLLLWRLRTGHEREQSLIGAKATTWRSNAHKEAGSFLEPPLKFRVPADP